MSPLRLTIKVNLMKSLAKLSAAIRCHLLGVALACLLPATALAQADAATIPEPAPIPEGLETVSFFSPALAREMKFDIVLPAGYDDSDEHYPVLYLLHG